MSPARSPAAVASCASLASCVLASLALTACELHDRDTCGLRNAHCSMVGPPDAAPIDAPPLPRCELFAPPGMSGCAAGEKCTWIVTRGGPEPDGAVSCVPAGTVPLHGACAVGPPGPATGFDDCVDGAICVGGACADICGRGAAPSESCGAGEQCRFTGEVFTPLGESPVAGACEVACDPVTQTPACGPGQGCYLLVSSTTTITVCATAGTIQPGQVILGQAFANACVPGAMPRRRDSASLTMECGALCRPADVAMGLNEAAEGGVAPHTCAARGAPGPGDPAQGESCRRWYTREMFTSGSPASNVVGWCVPHVELGLARCVDTATPDATTGCLTRAPM